MPLDVRAVFIAAAIVVGSSSAHAACKIGVFADLTLQPNPERALVDGAVNGHPTKFIIDTGAWASTMPFADAVRLGVKVDRSGFAYMDINVKSEGIGGTQEVGTVTFNMQLDKIDLPKEVMTAIPMRPLDNNAAALVGMDLIGQRDIELNLPGNNIKLIKVEGCTTQELAYWDKPYSQAKLESDGSGRSSIRVNVLLNGHVVPAMVDSGATQSIVTPEAARMAGLDIAQAEVSGDIGGIGTRRVSAQVATFNTFTLGDETIKNAKLLVSAMWKYNKADETGTRLGSHTQSLEQPRMLLGSDFLRAHRVLVANSMGMMVFSYMGGPVFDVSQARPDPGQTAPGKAAGPAPAH